MVTPVGDIQDTRRSRCASHSFGRDVIERMGAEDQIALGSGLGGQDRLADGLGRRNGLSAVG